MADIPVVVTPAGPVPTPPATLLADLIESVVAVNPGYTATLPSSLIEDISSTDVGALVIVDAARVETINSLTPFGANDFLLSQLGQIYIGPGSAPAPPTNTSVFVVFTAEDANTSAPLPGYAIKTGFTVSDGTFQYVIQDGGVTDSTGITPPLFCAATIAGQIAVPTNTVSQIVTSVPANVSLSCTNPEPGIPSAVAETSEQYRARVIQAGQAISTGTASLLKTLLGEIPGVQARLVSVMQQPGGGWIVIAGGGDPFLTAGAIFDSGLDVSVLVGATLAVTGITGANPGVVTTATNHNLSTGASVTMSGIVGMTPLNSVPVTVTVVSEKRFSVGIDTSSFPAYISGGVVAPNPINVTANINDPPNVYGIEFVNPPAQNVVVDVTYHTTQPNFASQAAVAQLAAPAIAAYINSIRVGAPMSLLVLEQTFADSVASALDPGIIASLVFAVSINGVSTPAVGQLISGDPFSFFQTTTASVVVTEV